MSHAAPGRHRTPVSARPRWRLPLLVAVVALLTVAIITAVIFWWPAGPSPSERTTSDLPSPSASAPDPSSSTTRATVESTSTVTVDGKTIVVEEVSSVADGDVARAVPSRLTPLGLKLLDASVIAPDGRSSSFDAPVTISANGSLTVRNRYLLVGCPDVVPAQWPSPTDFPGATRSYLRLDGPLHTAYAVCPESKPAADLLPELSGALIPGDTARVRLTWLGTQTLTIKAVGAVSGVAALVPNPDCDASCIGFVSPGGSTTIQLAPVDPCPPATDSDRLTLVVQLDGKVSIVAVAVAGLAKEVCA